MDFHLRNLERDSAEDPEKVLQLALALKRLNPSCREYIWDPCWCYIYVCPGPKNDPRGCGWLYWYSEYGAHWTEPGEPCCNCDEPIPDISCEPKRTLFND